MESIGNGIFVDFGFLQAENGNFCVSSIFDKHSTVSKSIVKELACRTSKQKVPFRHSETRLLLENSLKYEKRWNTLDAFFSKSEHSFLLSFHLTQSHILIVWY